VDRAVIVKCRWSRERLYPSDILTLSPANCPGTIAYGRLGAARDNRHPAEKRECLKEMYHKNEYAQLFSLNISACSFVIPWIPGTSLFGTMPVNLFLQMRWGDKEQWFEEPLCHKRYLATTTKSPR
jgi:hypothetical protein